MRLITFLLSMLMLVSTLPALAKEGHEFNDLYRVTLLRAAPGEFSRLLADMQNKSKRGNYHILRHSQGDHWDLMTIEHWGSYSAWFDPANPKRQTQDKSWREHLDRLSSYRSEWFAYGPDKSVIEQGVHNNDLYHVEMFRALAGHKIKLLHQRAIENDYLQQTGQVVNVVFKGDQGTDWDVMTIGFHKSLLSFAKGSDLSVDEKDKIAKHVGFKGVADIGPYLRSLLASHNDTLAVSVK
ncbi:MAG: hypothetical protein Alis3KO_36590 [Aliiglaciecola sp.]